MGPLSWALELQLGPEMRAARGALLLLGLPTAALAPQPNVLLIAVDDLRPEIGCFHPWSEADTILTPHLDGLARRGTLFSNAVVQFALCAPSAVQPPACKSSAAGPPPCCGAIACAFLIL